MSYQDSQNIVIDNGSGMTKAGFVELDEPYVSVPTVAGYPKSCAKIQESIHDWYACNEIAERAEILNIINPVQRGIVQCWESMEKIWHYLIFNELWVDPSESYVILTQPVNNPKSDRERMMALMFETFSVPALLIECQPILSMLGSGRSTGICVEVGHEVTQVVPIHEGNILSHAAQRQDIAGVDIDNYLKQSLVDKGYQIDPTHCGMAVIRQFKEKHAYVSLNKDELPKYATFSSSQGDIEIERAQGPELLFDPSLISPELQGLHKLVNESAMACDINIRQEMYSNIILAGGTTMLPGLQQRLQKEIATLAPAGASANVIAPDTRSYSAFRGAHTMAYSSGFEQKLMYKEEYDEQGIIIINRRLI